MLFFATYLPGEVVRRSFKRPTDNNFYTGTHSAKKYFNKISKPGSKLYSLFPAINESGHNTRTKKDFTFPLARTNRFKNSFTPWGIRKFKVQFSNCESSQFSSVYFFFLFYCMVCRVYCFCIILLMSIQSYGCKGNEILSYLFLRGKF